MDTATFVYTTYIRATPQEVWRGLTEPAFTRRYWGLAMESDWKVGSTVAIVLEKGGVRIEDPEQVVLEAEPFRRLAYTWHTFTPEWAKAYGISDGYLAKVAGEPRSKAAFDIEAVGQMSKLTVVHSDFIVGSTVLGSISEGWPVIVASFKTLLETGEPLPTDPDPELEEG
jgi:uncharacterized protein YndB with AHSA1/START domain